MKLKLAKMKEDDARFELKKGDIVLIDTDYDWDNDKAVCVGVLSIRNQNAVYKDQVELLEADQVMELK